MSKLIGVTNRSDCIVAYQIPEMHIVRSYAPNETKRVDLEELRGLLYQDGGEALLKDYLKVDNIESIDELQFVVSELYNLTDDDINEILGKGSNDDLTYFLKHAPAGSIDKLKNMAVNSDALSSEKNEIIFKLTGYNPASARSVKNQIAEYDAKKAAEDAAKGIVHQNNAVSGGEEIKSGSLLDKLVHKNQTTTATPKSTKSISDNSFEVVD